MRLLRKDISTKPPFAGSVRLLVEDAEDIWHAYNLIRAGDTVVMSTYRKVIKSSATGSTTSERKRITLSMVVDRVEHDTDMASLRIAGHNNRENEYVRMNAHHTCDLALNDTFTLVKEGAGGGDSGGAASASGSATRGTGGWDRVALDRLQEALDAATRGAEVAAIVMQEGLAHICIVTKHMTMVKSRVEVSIPKKRQGSSKHGSSLNRFFEVLYEGLRRHIVLGDVKCLLIGSPGFLKDDFWTYAQAEAVRREDRDIMDNRSKIVLLRSSSGHKKALEELLLDPAVQAQLADAKAAQEVHVLDSLLRTLNAEPDRVAYSYPQVNYADEQLAVEQLLVTDALFRSMDFVKRQQYIDLVESVRDHGGEVFVFSSMHVSGQQLAQLTGVAALLRFPMPDLDEMMVGEDGDEGDEDDEDDGDGDGDDTVLQFADPEAFAAMVARNDAKPSAGRGGRGGGGRRNTGGGRGGRGAAVKVSGEGSGSGSGSGRNSSRSRGGGSGGQPTRGGGGSASTAAMLADEYDDYAYDDDADDDEDQYEYDSDEDADAKDAEAAAQDAATDMGF